MREISSLDWSMEQREKNKWDPVNRISMRKLETINDTNVTGQPFTKNFRTIVFFSRFIGCHPHSLISRKKLKTTKIAKYYSSLWILPLLAAISYETQEFVKNWRSNESMIYTSPHVHNLTVLFGYLVHCVFSIVRAKNFDEASMKIREFDNAANIQKNVNIYENFGAAVLLILTWILIAWFNQLFNNIIDNPYLLLRAFIESVLILEIYKFCFVFGTLLRRFVKLKRIVISRKIRNDSSGGVCQKVLTVEDVFSLHRWLIDSAVNFNKYYNVQIVYWFCHFVSTLIIQASVLAGKYHVLHVQPRDLVRFAFTFYHLALLCAIPHFTCKRANELGPLLFGHGAPTLETTTSSLESLEFGFYLFKKPLKIMGLGFFYVDLPLLLSIVEALVTYTTFILQLSMPSE